MCSGARRSFALPCCRRHTRSTASCRSPQISHAAIGRVPDSRKTIFAGNLRHNFPSQRSSVDRLQELQTDRRTMYLPIPTPPQQNAPEPPAMVSSVTREDVMWDRPVFKAPPLNPKIFDARIFAEDLQRIGLVQR